MNNLLLVFKSFTNMKILEIKPVSLFSSFRISAPGCNFTIDRELLELVTGQVFCNLRNSLEIFLVSYQIGQVLIHFRLHAFHEVQGRPELEVTDE